MLRSITPPSPTSSWRSARLMVRTATPFRSCQDGIADGCAGKPAHPDIGIASDASASALLRVAVLEGVAAGGEERLLQGGRVVAALEVVRRLEAEQFAVVEDPDAVGERLGLGQVVGAEQDGRVVLGAHLADELLHLLLGAGVEAGRRLVQQQ